ncbi:MAG TPA: hypothetical protein VLE97_11570 [Gaiellaceae bacterium]|nr:hypothetical protein [Gaiellaceae bacterium]
MARAKSSSADEFVDYLLDFYGPGGIYTRAGDPFHRPMKREEAKSVTTVMIAQPGFEGDTVDREKARDIVLGWRDKIASVEESEALARQSGARKPLRVPLSKGLGQAIRRHSGTAVFDALKSTARGYVFESADPGVVRAFWFATNDVLHRPATRAVGDAVVKLRTELRPIIEQSWPEAIAR